MASHFSLGSRSFSSVEELTGLVFFRTYFRQFSWKSANPTFHVFYLKRECFYRLAALCVFGQPSPWLLSTLDCPPDCTGAFLPTTQRRRSAPASTRGPDIVGRIKLKPAVIEASRAHRFA